MTKNSYLFVFLLVVVCFAISLVLYVCPYTTGFQNDMGQWRYIGRGYIALFGGENLVMLLEWVRGFLLILLAAIIGVEEHAIAPGAPLTNKRINWLPLIAAGCCLYLSWNLPWELGWDDTFLHYPAANLLDWAMRITLLTLCIYTGWNLYTACHPQAALPGKEGEET